VQAPVAWLHVSVVHKLPKKLGGKLAVLPSSQDLAVLFLHCPLRMSQVTGTHLSGCGQVIRIFLQVATPPTTWQLSVVQGFASSQETGLDLQVPVFGSHSFGLHLSVVVQFTGKPPTKHKLQVTFL
jgi:hypothetical protein